jgi:hypothetical protein
MKPPTRLCSLCCVAVVAGSLGAQDAWQLKHKFVNRYEGLIDIPTGNPPMEVLTFVAYFQEFVGRQEWRVRYFSPTRTQVTIYARDMDDEVQYWMESIPKEASPNVWSEFRGWDTGDVLIKEKVKASSVGVTAMTNGAERSYLPALVYPATAALPPAIEFYKLRLRANRHITRVDYILSGVTKPNRPSSRKFSLPGEHFAGDPFLLELDAREFSEGPMHLVIQAVNGEAPVASKEFNFYHRPRTD